jgi:hypothetical protein
MQRHSPIDLTAFVLAMAILLSSYARANVTKSGAIWNQAKYNQAIDELKKEVIDNPEWEFGHRALALCYRNSSAPISVE